MGEYHFRENMGVNNQYIQKVRDMDPDERQELIDDFRTAANIAWNNDFNASIIGLNLLSFLVRETLFLGRDFEIDLGGRTRYNSEQDSAEDPLFSWLSDELKERKTYSTFMKLMDNYSAETGEQEEMTEEEIEEQWAFLDAICETEVMKYTHQWLVNKELAPEDMDDFKEALNNIWFNMYGRYEQNRTVHATCSPCHGPFKLVTTTDSRQESAMMTEHKPEWIPSRMYKNETYHMF